MKKLILGLGCLVLAGMALFPPWQVFVFDEGNTAGPVPAGYHFLLRQRVGGQGRLQTYAVDLNHLLVQMGAVIFVLGAVALLVPKREPSQRQRY